MIDLLSAEGDAALAGLAATKTLYAFDFDGTLAPIVDRPDAARAGDRTVELLAELAQHVPTALVTGRGLDDLRRRIAFEPTHRIGNHGAEGLPPTVAADAASLEQHAAIVAGWERQFRDASAALPAGIVVEPKRYSLSLHYRQASHHDEAERVLRAFIGRLEPPPRVIGGKCVVNLLPDGAPDKGQALRTLVAFEGCDAAFFIGDDLTDEAAFVDAPDRWVTVRVGADPKSAARYFVSDQTAVERCLEALLRQVAGRSAAG